MARRLFYVDEVRKDHAELTGDDARHLTKVLRVEVGQIYEISDGQQLYLAEVEAAHKSLVSFRVTARLPAPAARIETTLYASLFKFDHFEWMLEKATELGVAHIQPVIAERSERGLDQAAHKRMERWARILMESGQQSRRMQRPTIAEAVKLTNAINNAEGLRLVLEEQPGCPSLLAALKPGTENLSLLLGPEGGWSDRDRSAITAAGWQPCSLGPNILRAETAATAALAIVSVWSLTADTL